MNKLNVLLVVGGLLLLNGCAKVYTVTDTVTLYPANAAAQPWGKLNFYSQYQRQSIPGEMTINLPNGQMLRGQMTYLDSSESNVGGFWDNVRVGVGVGHHFRHGSVGFGVSPSFRSYRSDKQQVSINSFGAQLSMNCQGEFNRRQKSGTLQCMLTNGMRYRGTLRRVITLSQ